MSWGSPETILSLLAILIVGRGITTAIRVKAGASDLDWRARRGGEKFAAFFDAAGLADSRKIELLANENATLKGQITRLEERVAVLERIATDPAKRLETEIEGLR
ncbi:MAG: hypothetical protein RQ833_04795 [Sphingomonadaceae bacterium]|nr:hypothetical protein [Sphingomonadaceae bacterium]